MLRSPYLRPMHIRTRLTWCKGHIDGNTDWSLVVFTDEENFNLHGNDGPKRAWKRKGSPNHEILVNKNDRRSVMVWGSISLCGKTGLEIMVGEPVNAERYCTTLATKFVDFQQRNPDVKFMLMHDNAAAHTASRTKRWLRDNDIVAIPWPANSPDLNPIENLWALMVREVYKINNRPQTIPELIEAIKRA